MKALDRLLTERVTVVRAAVTRDRYGNAGTDWDTATRTDTPAWIEPTGASENDDQRSGQRAVWRLIVPVGVDITGRDRIEYQGETFEIDGPPLTLRTPRGPHHVEAVLRWVEG